MADDVRMTPDWERHLAGPIDAMLTRLGSAVLSDAERGVPVDTGRLRQSLAAEVSDGTLRVGSTDVEYSTYVELGTRHQRPQPYLRPALYRRRVL